MLLRRSILLALLICALSAHSQSNAVTQLADLRQQARAALAAHDNARAIALIQDIRRFQHDSPNAWRTLSRVLASTGDNGAALDAIHQTARMGLVDEAFLNAKPEDKDPILATLKSLPAATAVVEQMEVNRKPIALAERVFDLSDANLVAEDIDYDPATKSFFITSVLEKKIIRISRNARATTDFAKSPSGWPMMALRIDTRLHLVWATEVALDTFVSVPKADWGNSAVLCFDARTGRLLHRTLAPHTALADMAIAPNGDPILSDGANGGIYRLHNNTLTRIDQGDFVSPQTAAVLDAHHLLIPDYVRGLGVLDLDTHSVTWLTPSVPDQPHATMGVDGAYLHGHTLFVTQNGVTPERVVRFTLDAARTHITAEEVIERGTSTLGDPTHGVLLDGWFYYIANSGWTELNDDGTTKPGTSLTPAHLMRYQLPKK